MEEIRSLNMLLTAEGPEFINQVPNPVQHDGLYLSVQANREGTEVSGGQFIYRHHGCYIHHRFQGDCELSALAFRLGDSIGGKSEDSLLARLQAYLDNMSADDLDKLTNIYPMGIAPMNMRQRALDLFAMGCLSYLSVLYLLQRTEVRDQLPMTLTFPLSSFDMNVFSQSICRYMGAVSVSFLSLTEGLIRAMFEAVIAFTNVWTDLFDEGPRVDDTRGVMDMLVGYANRFRQLI